MDDWMDVNMAESNNATNPTANSTSSEDESQNPFAQQDPQDPRAAPWPLSAATAGGANDTGKVECGDDNGAITAALMAQLFPNKDADKVRSWLEMLQGEEVDSLSDLAELNDNDWTALGLPRGAILHLRTAAAKWVAESKMKNGGAAVPQTDISTEVAKAPPAPPAQVDVIVVDISKSMKAASSVDSLQSREDVSKVLFSIIVDAISSLEKNHAVGLVAFGEYVHFSADITKDYEMFQTILGRLDANEGGTRLWDAVATAAGALKKFTQAHCPDARMRVLALTDGQDNSSQMGSLEVARDCREAGVVVDVVPLAGTRHEQLRSLAAATGGLCLGVSAIEQAVSLFAREPVIHLALREEGALPELTDRMAFIALGSAAETVVEVAATVPAAMKEPVMDTASVKKLEVKAAAGGANGNASAAVLKRLMSEYRTMESDPASGCYAFINCNDIKFWKAVISGPADTPYEGRSFALSVRFPNDYPFKPPAVSFITPIYHPNINADGAICLDILSHQWSPALSLSKILVSIRSLLQNPNPDEPLDAYKGAMMQHEPDRFNVEARQHAQKHGLVLDGRTDVERYCSQ